MKPFLTASAISLMFLTAGTGAEVTSDGDLPWSFRRLARPEVDARAFGTWPRDDLDFFIARKLAEKGLRPSQEADRRTLIRRAAFDLTGLPPTLEETKQFLRDPASDELAFAKVVDAYLASPRFGERWGRHWLDVARYADSVGRTWNAPFVYAWRYRDWVIESLNEDQPYDEFITDQIAGDLVSADTVAERRKQVIATGFLTLGSLSINQGGQETFLLDQIDDQIDVTTRGFLALSIACARCHDHKYDPVAQMDYYALAGIFYSSWTYPGQAHVSDHTSAGYIDPEMLVRLPTEPDEPIDRVRSIPNRIHTMGDLRSFGGKAPPPFDLEPDWAMGMRDGKPVNCALREGGVAWDEGETPRRGDLRIPGLPDFPRVPDDSSGRLELAHWITDPRNPLTARVAVNRIWYHLFGRGLVESIDNFGLTGQEPTHPELLDHLATRFVEGGWSRKQLIRSIILSRTYQLGSGHDAKAYSIDPDNTLYWRASPRRLELEALRDSLLFTAGVLEEAAPAPGNLAGNGSRGRGRTRSEIGFSSPYRTIYLPVIRDFLPDEYGVFDFPDPSSVAGQRHVTTAPPQALFFMNSRFVEDCAYDLADRLFDLAETEPDRIDIAYELILNRKPDSEEREAATRLMDSLDTSGLQDSQGYRWATFLQSLYASAEFRYVL